MRTFEYERIWFRKDNHIEGTNDDLNAVAAYIEGKYGCLCTMNLLQDHQDVTYTKSAAFLVIPDNTYKVDDSSQNFMAAIYSWKYHQISLQQ